MMCPIYLFYLNRLQKDASINEIKLIDSIDINWKNIYVGILIEIGLLYPRL